MAAPIITAMIIIQIHMINDIQWSLFLVKKLVISIYAKEMSVSDIEEEMRDIYEIGLYTSAIPIITTKSIRLPWSDRTAPLILFTLLSGWTVSSSRYGITVRS